MAAVFGFSGPPDPSLETPMSTALRHRGAEQQWSRSPHGTLGWRGDRQSNALPLGGVVTREDAQLVLCGYLVADAENGPQPPDLEALLERFCADGPRAACDLRGAFVIVVRHRDDWYLVRDGVGVRTAYYAEHRGRLLFGVEPKAIWSAPGFSRQLRPAAVAQYLTYSFVPGSGTMLAGISELLPGHVLHWRDGMRGEQPFIRFERSAADAEQAARHDWPQRFRDLHARATRQRLPDNEPVGVFLSGGLDSSVVTAEVVKWTRQPVRTYSIHFGSRYHHELDFARQVAERCGTDHEEVLIEPAAFIPRLRQIVWHLDDPIGDPITVPNFELAAHVARDVRWVFNGEGGDPAFGGPKNIPMLLAHWYGERRAENFREVAYLSSYRRCYDDLQRLLTPDFQRRLDPQRDLEAIVGRFFQQRTGAPLLDTLCEINLRLKGAHLILPKVDRMMGAAGLTPASPLFDEELVQFSFQMPPRMRLDQGVEKVVIKHAYRDLLPAEVVWRPKSGMRVPVHFWFQKEMRRYARKLLNRRQLRRDGIFDPARVQQLLDYSIEEGPGRYGLRLWMLLTFELWRRIVLEGETP